MDIGKSFSYVFDDPKWVTKVLIGGVLTILSIVILPAFVLFGYTLQTIRNVMAGQERPLPEWTDFGALFIDGLKAFVVVLIYIAPGIVLSMLSGVRDVGVLFNCLGTIYSLAIQIVLPAAIGLYLQSDDIGAALRFQEVIDTVQRNLSDFIVIWLLGIVASIIGGLGIIACGIGLIFTLPYSLMVRAHLWGQLLNKVRGGGALPVPTTTPLEP
jgi:uncharacterized membrane protein